MMRTFLLIAVTALAACASAHQSPNGRIHTVVVRLPTYLDSVGLARNTGSIRIAVRRVDRPTESVIYPEITLMDSAGRAIWKRRPTESGVIRMDSIPTAQYSAQIRRIGYDFFTVPITVTAGCVVEVEAYLRQDFLGISTPARMQPRSTTTVCEVKR